MEMVTLARFLTSMEAELLRIRLEREGVSCRLANQQLQNMSGATGGFSPGASVTQGVWLQVQAEDVERAQAILATIGPTGDDAKDSTAQNTNTALDEEAEAAVRCPFCGAENIEYTGSAIGATNVIVGVCGSCGSEWQL